MARVLFCAVVSAVATAMTASLLTTTAGYATTPRGDEIVQVLEAVPAELPVMQNVSTEDATDLVEPGSTSSDGAAIREAAAVDVSEAGKDPMAVELLAAQSAPSVSVSTDGVEVLDNGDSSLTVPLAREDGSLQIVFVVESPSAPSTYAIDIDLPDGAVLTQDEGGALLARRADGQLTLGVAPAWAFDAAGTPVPTRYVVDGGKITQVVDHNLGTYQYPISADPWLGIRLFDPMRVNRKGPDEGKNVYSGRLTAWGVSMGLSPAGLAIMSTAGMEEFTSQWAAVRNSKSLKQQYLCHAIWGRAIIGAGFWWDLEAWRPANANYARVWEHQCNWGKR